MSGAIVAGGIIAAILGTLFMYKRRALPFLEAYTIKKGQHFSRIWQRFIIPLGFNIVTSKVIRYEVMFGKGCNYKDNNDGDLNKLCGVSYGLDNHWRSVRIAWIYDDFIDKIMLWSYVYVKGRRTMSFLCSVPLYEEFTVHMNHFPDNEEVVIQIFDVHGKTIPVGPLLANTWIVYGIDKSWINIKQFPFYGGDKPAPNDMTIYLMEL